MFMKEKEQMEYQKVKDEFWFEAGVFKKLYIETFQTFDADSVVEHMLHEREQVYLEAIGVKKFNGLDLGFAHQ